MPTSARNAGFIRVDVGIDPYDSFMIVSMVNSILGSIRCCFRGGKVLRECADTMIINSALTRNEAAVFTAASSLLKCYDIRM